jgi:hypothetical protein
MPVRPIRIVGEIAFVPLTKGKEAAIDASDAALVGQHNWYAVAQRRGVYYAERTGPPPEKRTIRMHRAILGEPFGFEVDHRDSDGLNNRRSNLRIATVAQNQWNRRTQVNSTSGFKGVTWSTREGKWRARISVNKQRIELGYFVDPTDANAAYLQAAERYHGEFSRENV